MPTSYNQATMQNLAANIASQAKIGDVFGLKGTLGAGKSFFASSFINSLLDKKTPILIQQCGSLKNDKIKRKT